MFEASLVPGDCPSTIAPALVGSHPAMPTPARRIPEILAPAGEPACLPAAVAGGAHAVYFGLRHFNARGRAENFRLAELPGHVDWLHGHGLKCYVVLNTLLHDDEFPKALELAAAAHRAGVDATIVQDLGLWSLLRRELPGFELHASTQQTVHHPSQLAALAGIGCKRVVLARELSLAEVRACTVAGAALGVETEHFVHGALCYAFSGQCLMSNFAGCRSANRGTCAQNCRYDYVAGGDAPETRISLKDLNLLGRVGDLADAGVASLKIEGRLKGPDYVYTVSRAYRAAVDAWATGKPFAERDAQERLKEVFARTAGDQPLAARYDDAARLHRYEPEADRQPDAALLRCDRARGEAVLRSTHAVVAGQGYRFAVGMVTGGFLVIHASAGRNSEWTCRIRIAEHGPRLPAGLDLFRNSDHERRREADSAMAAVPLDASTPTVAVGLHLVLRAGQPAQVRGTTADGRQAEVVGTVAVAPATGRPVTLESLPDSLGAMGGTAFRAETFGLDADTPLFVPAAELKRLRRDLVTALEAQPIPTPVMPTWTPAEPVQARRRATKLWVAVGSLEAAHAALAAGATAAWLDDAALDLWGASAPTLPRLPGLWLRHPATAPLSPHLAAIGLPVVAGHLGVLVAAVAAGLAVVADHSLNICNLEALRQVGAFGAMGGVLSLEDSGREVARVMARIGAGDAPVAALCVHGRLPSMLTRQDHGLRVGEVRDFRAVPADGGLAYQWQRRHHDTVVWEGRRLCAPEHVQPTAGLVDAWLLELADLDAAAVTALVGAYAALRDGGDAQAVRDLAALHAPHGLFPGHLELGSRELDRVVSGLGE